MHKEIEKLNEGIAHFNEQIIVQQERTVKCEAIIAQENEQIKLVKEREEKLAKIAKHYDVDYESFVNNSSVAAQQCDSLNAAKGKFKTQKENIESKFLVKSKELLKKEVDVKKKIEDAYEKLKQKDGIIDKQKEDLFLLIQKMGSTAYYKRPVVKKYVLLLHL